MEPNARKKTSAENDEHHYDSDTDLNKTFIESFIRTKKNGLHNLKICYASLPPKSEHAYDYSTI